MVIRNPQYVLTAKLTKISNRDSEYQRPQYSSTRSDELVLRKLGLCNVCMNIDFQGLSTNRKPKDRYEVHYGPVSGQPFSLACSLCQVLWRDILELSTEAAPSHSVTFDFTPIHATTSHRGNTSDVLIGVWYRGGSKYGHLVFSASLGTLIFLESLYSTDSNM
jgi:hypothetical protein